MGLDERVAYWLFGCLIGFVLGYIVRSLHEIKEELDEVDAIVKQREPAKNEDGFVRHPIVMDFALLIVVILTVWAAFASQKASNDVQNTQEHITRITVCNQEFLAKTIKALNERTTYTQEQASANVELQRAQAKFLDIVLLEPPATKAQQHEALRKYFDALTKFVQVSGKSDAKADTFPYPTNEELSQCLSLK